MPRSREIARRSALVRLEVERGAGHEAKEPLAHGLGPEGSRNPRWTARKAPPPSVGPRGARICAL
eukprot:9948320-Alexandrium_andersonii.AAC.1